MRQDVWENIHLVAFYCFWKLIVKSNSSDNSAYNAAHFFPELADEYTVIVVEASLDTDFSYLEGLGYHIYKEKKYKTNQHVFMQKKD